MSKIVDAANKHNETYPHWNVLNSDMQRVYAFIAGATWSEKEKAELETDRDTWKQLAEDHHSVKLALTERVAQLEALLAQWQKTWDEFTPMNAAKNQRVSQLESALQTIASTCEPVGWGASRIAAEALNARQVEQVSPRGEVAERVTAPSRAALSPSPTAQVSQEKSNLPTERVSLVKETALTLHKENPMKSSQAAQVCVWDPGSMKATSQEGDK